MQQESFFDFGEAIPDQYTGASKSGCEKCKLSDNCKSPKFTFKGKGGKKILIIMENPTGKEDSAGKAYISQQAIYLRDTLKELGYNLHRDCWYGYAVSCHTNKKIEDQYIGYCQEHLYSEINRFDPKVIIPLGTIAIKAVLKYRIGGRLSGLEYKEYIGHAIPDQEWGIQINPNYSPQYLFRTENYRGDLDKVTVMRFQQYLKAAFQYADDGRFYKHNYNSDTLIYFDEDEICELLETVLETWKLCVFDYETNGLKPHREGHKIYTIGISDGMLGHAFPYLAHNKRFVRLWRMILKAPDIKKVAHNAKFEDSWSHFCVGKVKINNWHWCTMVGEHLLKNTSKVGAKYLFYCYFGVLNMDSEVDKYLKASKKEESVYGDNAINNIEHIWKENPKAVLKYQADDAFLTAKLYNHQVACMSMRGKRDLERAFHFFLESTLAIGHMEWNGIPFDEALFTETHEYLSEKIDGLTERIHRMPEAEGWNGKLGGKVFQKHLYDTLKYPEPTIEEKLAPGNRPESAVALDLIGTPFTKKIVQIRKQEKIRSTIEGYKRESVNCVIRPSYGTTNVPTFRTSANHPNIQNPFKRNKYAKTMLRKMIRPSPGRKIVSADYSQVEVIMAGCIYPDPRWLAYCVEGDMHSDSAAEILRISTDRYFGMECAGSVRQGTKGGWVFSNIYGAGIMKRFHGMWELLTSFPETLEILIEKGLNTPAAFEKWIREYNDIYWGEKFPDYKRLRDADHKKYEKYGYTDSPVGYRYYGPMSYNDFCNWKVQGTACAVKLWTLNELDKAIKKNKMDSRIIYEIHDDIGADVVPDEEEEYNKLLLEVGTIRIREAWDWIKVPLKMDFETSAVDGNWAEMEGIPNPILV